MPDIDANATGTLFNGIYPDYTGYSVDGIGDINGDKIDDFVIGAPASEVDSNTFAGQVFVVFGTTTVFTPPFDLTTLDGTNGFIIKGLVASSGLGWAVSGKFDINDDTHPDLIITAPFPDGSEPGQVYVIFGKAEGDTFPSSFDLNSLSTGVGGFIINGINNNDQTGISASGTKDINGDSIDDLLIGARYASPDSTTKSSAGQVFVIFGKKTSFNSTFDLSSLVVGVDGFIINGADFNLVHH